ncbi:hypothetical protein M407DRAFT_243368 [Tulasnella calospora MUT 4182]|uniref:Uncharacterized protein n=1 Tax=Tulasnella calospora MUT 4182 TaxID=1051891 RepID=A0A0C3QAT3_9AGAM|nr:hypothetical protein M407DRAFT_243368 [Tulasnella calospora MUT 4182]
MTDTGEERVSLSSTGTEEGFETRYKELGISYSTMAPAAHPPSGMPLYAWAIITPSFAPNPLHASSPNSPICFGEPLPPPTRPPNMVSKKAVPANVVC